MIDASRHSSLSSDSKARGFAKLDEKNLQWPGTCGSGWSFGKGTTIHAGGICYRIEGLAGRYAKTMDGGSSRMITMCGEQ